MFDNPETLFCVVRNQEDQYSIWPTSLPLPAGWEKVDYSGSKAECLDRIAEVWTDMRPASLRALDPR